MDGLVELVFIIFLTKQSSRVDYLHGVTSTIQSKTSCLQHTQHRFPAKQGSLGGWDVTDSTLVLEDQGNWPFLLAVARGVC